METDNKVIKKYDINTPAETSIPQIWGKNPIFAATKQKGPREVVLADGAVWKMGVQPPRGEITNPEYLRGFDVRHAELIFRLLAFYRENDIKFTHKVDISYYKLLEIVGWERGNANLKRLKDVLADMENIWTEIIVGERYFKFRILSASEEGFVSEKEKAKLGFIVFDATFLQFLGDIEHFFSIRLDVFNAMSSGIAKAVYLYLPSRALKNTEASPFKITLTNLYKQINVTVSAYKSKRFEKITQNKKSVISQLNGALISFNKKLCISLEETKSKDDYNLCAWTKELSDKDYVVPGNYSLRSWFINGKRGTGKDFHEKIKNLKELNIYELQSLDYAGVNVRKDKIFLMQSKTVLGEQIFAELCGTVKDRSETAKIKSPTAFFINSVKCELLGELNLF